VCRVQLTKNIRVAGAPRAHATKRLRLRCVPQKLYSVSKLRFEWMAGSICGSMRNMAVKSAREMGLYFLEMQDNSHSVSHSIVINK